MAVPLDLRSHSRRGALLCALLGRDQDRMRTAVRPYIRMGMHTLLELPMEYAVDEARETTMTAYGRRA